MLGEDPYLQSTVAVILKVAGDPSKWGLRWGGGVFLRTEQLEAWGEDGEGKWGPCRHLLMMVGRKHKRNFSGIGTKGSSPR